MKKLITILLLFSSFNIYAQPSGNALDFDGTNDYASGSGISTSLTNITLEAWVYHHTLPASIERYVTVCNEVAVIRHDGASQQGQLHFYVKVGVSLHHIRVDNVLQTGQWYHVVGTLTYAFPECNMKLYLNGECVGTKMEIFGTLYTPNGNVQISRPAEVMDGYIDEVRIWDHARTPEEIRANMYKTLTGTEPGLENYWMFNESSGSTAYDNAGSVNLTLNNMYDDDWVTSGAFTGPRNTLDYDGSNDYVQVNDNSTLDITASLTIEAWIKADSWETNYWEGTIVGKDKSDKTGYNLRCGENGRLSFVNGISGSWPEVRSSEIMSTDTWYHVCGVYDGASQKIYINGELVGENNASGSVGTNDLDLFIGSSPGYSGRLFDGKIEEVRIWNDVRTPAEIRENMCQTLAGNESGLVAYYRFDQEEGTTLYDIDWPNNNGTLTNMADNDWVSSSAFNTWIGWYSNVWTDSFNWSRGIVPNSNTENVGFPAGGGSTFLSGNFTCNNLIIGTGSNLNISSGSTLTISNSIINAGTLSGDGLLKLSGRDSAYELNGIFSNLELDDTDGAMLTDNLTINGTMTLTNGALTTNGYALSYGPDGTLKYNGTSLQTTTSNEFPSTNNPKNLIINNAAGVNLAFNRTIDSTLILTNGDLDLNGDTLTLGVNATLSESDGNTVKGDSGIIITTRTFNAGDLSTGVNIAGMGAGIMTDSALGETTIIRGHVAQSNGNIEGILRYYDISPANNSGLYGTLTFHYDDTELNGIVTESQLALFRSTDTGNTWSAEGGAANTANNTILLSGIDAFSRWTAFTTGFAKSVSFYTYSSDATWGDYDNDGDLDILLTDWGIEGNLSHVYRNDGSGTFTDIVAGLTGVKYSSVAWGDYNNDGNLDILLTGDEDYFFGLTTTSRVYRNNSSGIFTDINAGLPGVYHSSVAWGDYDNDGDLDILMTGDSGSGCISRVYRNDGSGYFTNINAGLPGVYHSSVAWGDYDNDGDLDILLTGANILDFRFSRVYRNNGSGTFNDINAGLTGVSYSSVAWGDYDNDGDLDILLTGNDGSGGISRVYRNDGSDAFNYINAGLTGVENSSVAWGDYDNDGDLDILLTGNDGSSRISRVYRNDGSDAFNYINAGLTGVENSSVAWGDYDNDGDLDILLTGDSDNGSISCIYRNDLLVANTAPGIPGNLSASVSGQDVTLGWDKATDNETAQDALTYNICIGILPGGVQTVSPMADVSSGYRKVAALGNTNHNISWEIYGLIDNSTYYWSVQAVDNAFAGSAFAIEGSFVIPDYPNITTTSITNITPTTASSGGNVTDEGNFPVTVKGIVWDTIKNPTVAANMGITNDGSGIGSFTSSLTGLSGVGQTYYVRAYATNSEFTAYGGQKIFATPMIPPGNALDFDGINDYVETTLNDLSGSEITIEYWFKGSSTQSAVRQQNGDYIVAGWNDLHIISTDGGTGSGIAVGTGAEDGNWHHIAMSWQQNTVNGFKSYLDGNFVAQRTSNDISLPNIDANVILGSFSGTQEFMYGTLDEVRIWNIARDSVQIRENMHRTLNGVEANLVAYYRFDHISGTALSDRTSNDNDGTLINMDDWDWLSSTAPIPYFTVYDGNWEVDSVWAAGQNAPVYQWSRAKIKHNITLNSNMELLELIIDTNAIMTISTGNTLTVGEE